MISNVNNSVSATKTYQISTTRNKSTLSNAISPTYSNDISTTSNPIKISIVKDSDLVAFKSLEKELNTTFSKPGLVRFDLKVGMRADDPNKGIGDIHVYDIGDLGEKIGLPLASTKIVSQINSAGERSYRCSLKGDKTCEIVLFNNKQIDKPLDATTLKNVILKAMALQNSANDCKEAIKGRCPGTFSNWLSYDPNTKTANFKEFNESNEKSISEIYMRYNGFIETDKPQSAAYSKYQDDLWEILNKIL
ncbi:hypothetical protein [Fusibacter sp. 3D3]|uniref:hypothetical protein n=1 Tax=Fusibacter sp. 3D3 TaxID=1048380 RepID=UPI00085306A8|nr:hypothetical protein [Fusibacter sp. 3D3]GAU75813.1 hypothetical protein F3D3_0409 [Fusibacter sp. 3D3]